MSTHPTPPNRNASDAPAPTVHDARVADARRVPDARAVADRFSPAAAQYAVSEQRGGDDLAAVVDAVRPVGADLVVDVATGPGSTALALAEVARRVLGTDLSEGMVATARQRAAEAGLPQVTFEVAPADHLPVVDGAVDALTCRIAAHHFPDVPAWLTECARVVRPGGRLVVLDSEAPDDPEVAAFLEAMEIRRDPTHVRAFSAAAWHELIAAAGFTELDTARYPKPKAFEPWLARGGIDEAEQAAVRRFVAAAPPAVVAALHIELDEAGAPVRFSDDKVLVVAERDAT
jgi:ubiquinone/menaquinone biosynthesis C-methylase UbiE